MRMIKATTQEQTTLTGVKVEQQIVDGKVEAITITDVDGKQIRIVKSSEYGTELKILIEEPKEYVTLWDVYVEGSDGGVTKYTADYKAFVDNKIAAYGETMVRVVERQEEVKKDLTGRVIQGKVPATFTDDVLF